MGPGDPHARDDLPEDVRRARLALGGEGGEDGADADRSYPRVAYSRRCLARGRLVELHDGPAVVLVAAADEMVAGVDDRREVLRPVAELRQRSARGKADPDRRHRREEAALDHRVGEVGGADDGGLDGPTVDPRPREQLVQGGDDSAHDLVGGGGLDRLADFVADEEHRIGVGATDVDPDPASGLRYGLVHSSISSHRAHAAVPFSLVERWVVRPGLKWCSRTSWVAFRDGPGPGPHAVAGGRGPENARRIVPLVITL